MDFTTTPDVSGPHGPVHAEFYHRSRYATYSPDQYQIPPYRRRDGPNPNRAEAHGSKRPVQTVEDILERGYFTPPSGAPATAVVTDKRHTAWLGLDDTIAQVRARCALYERNMQSILYATASATNALHAWEAERGWPSDRQLDSLQRTLQSLYAQERDERIALWRDVARVRASLPEAFQNYLSAYRKLQLLGTPGGEAR
jgi:hypothetical protein